MTIQATKVILQSFFFIASLAKLWALECILVLPTAALLPTTVRLLVREIGDVGHSAEKLEEFYEDHMLCAIEVIAHVLYRDLGQAPARHELIVRNHQHLP